MDLEISLKNIEKLKDFIMPFECQHIYFDFNSDTEFTTKFYDDDSTEFVCSIMKLSQKRLRPYARILIRNYLEIFYYYDSNIYYEFDLTNNKLIASAELKCDFDLEKIKTEYNQLVDMLKKIS